MKSRLEAGGVGVRLLLWVTLVLTGALVLPVGAYLAGQRLAGPYEGQYGLAHYVGSIYGAAGRGEPLALLLLTAPILIALAWALPWPGRRPGHGASAGESPEVGREASTSRAPGPRKTPYISDT